MSDTCEHGHLSSKCEVCELKAEVARLRSVCREAAEKMANVQPYLSSYRIAYRSVCDVVFSLRDAGKEATDGQ